jgi:hypothetical protein
MVNKAITFDLDGGDLKVPVVGQYELSLPPYFATKTKKGWKLLNPITTIRNLAKRNKELVVDLNRRPSSLEPEIKEEDGVDMPSIEDFNPADQAKLRKWDAQQNKSGKYHKTDTPVRPRGRPAFLPKNAQLQGLTYKKGTKHYGDNLKKVRVPQGERKPRGRPRKERPPESESDSDKGGDSESDNESGVVVIRRQQGKRGRPRKEKPASPPAKETREQQKERVSKNKEEKKTRKEEKETKKRIEKESKEKKEKEDKITDALWNAHLDAEEALWWFYPDRSPYGSHKDKFDNSVMERKFGDRTKPKQTADELMDIQQETGIASRVQYTGNQARHREAFERFLNGEKEIPVVKSINPKIRPYSRYGRGLSSVLNTNRSGDSSDSDDDGDEYNDGRDGTGRGGSIFSGLLSKVKSLVINPVEAVVNKVSDIGHKVIHGRMDYPPSAKAIIDKYADQQVQGVSLHRLVLPSVYTGILSLWTGGETEKRLKEEPKDKLFHISMWVKLPNAVILCEKNEVIHLQVNPKKAKEEEEQDAPTPSNTTFRELLEKGRASVGDEKFFSYSAKSNNCGNWIEYILRANGIENQSTKDFIGQDAHKILEGFPRLRRTLNTLTDIAGRANVVLEGGDLPDWEHLKWGSFTKQFEAYNHEHPDNGIDDLEHFAKSILANPKEYQPRTLKRARFYLNVILKKKSHHNNIMPSHRLNGGAVVGLPISNAVMKPVSDLRMRPVGGDPRTWSPMPIHTLHPNAMDTIYHAPTAVPNAGSGIHHHHHYYQVSGEGMWDWLDPNKNGVAKTFDPNQNGVADAVKSTFTPDLGRAIAKPLIHEALPAVISTLASSGTTALTGNPLAGFAVGQTLGKYAGKKAGDALGNEVGLGLKPKRLVKGSAEAKAFMASIRKKKGGKGLYGGAIPAPHSRNVITDPSML